MKKSNSANPTLHDHFLSLAAQRYGGEPDHPWMNHPDFSVLRHAASKKWYALVMRVPRDKLGLSGEGDVEVVNLKADPMMVGSVRLEHGILPAYHMNKASWITVLLDGSVAPELLGQLLDISFQLTGPKAKSARSAAKIRNTVWLVPANPKYYDIETALAKSTDGIFLWKQSNSIALGDTVYLYVASPVSAIRYRCKAIEVNIPYQSTNSRVNIHRSMRLQLIAQYDSSVFPFSVLKQYGVTAVRGPRSIPNSLLRKLEQS